LPKQFLYTPVNKTLEGPDSGFRTALLPRSFPNHQGQSMSSANISERIAGLARQVRADPASIGVLSTGEACAVALLLNRLDLLDDNKHPLDALERLGLQWE
jgi:hypothetical protein